MLIKMRKMMTNQKGFTLVELMVVIAILGILAAIAIPKMTASTNAAKDGKLIADLRTLDGAIMMSYADKKVFPADLAVLKTDKLIAEVPTDAKGVALTYTPATSGYQLSGSNSAGTVIPSPGSDALTK
jgi:general secretion pathway protein G